MKPSSLTVLQHIESVLGIADMTPTEQADFLEQVGTLVMESAVLKYCVGLDTAARNEFEAWLTHTGDTEAFLALASEAYPAFAEILVEEMDMFRSETARLLGTPRPE